ncbi:hypothetical protein [Leifsonia sp. NPDC058230]|uniref:hypothetical protein n=1 Tax=Leifsonia sp. NPDC058230 TaxID=3346391 RepID=UPI0036DA2A6E
MSGRRMRKAVLGVPVLIAGLTLVGCSQPSVCPAIGYLYRGPAVVELSGPPAGGATLAACFGDECEPAVVERSDGTTWEIPQEAPYLDSAAAPAGTVRSLRVVVTGEDAGVLSDAVHEIPTEPVGSRFGDCPGPFRFSTLHITVDA